MGEPGYRYAWWRRLSLWLLLVLSPSLAAAVELEVRELRDDPPVAEVLAGLHDARLLPPRDRPYLKQPTRSVQWWRVAARGPVAAGDRPQLLLRSPYLYRVEAWAPGAAQPTRHALYGDDADMRHAPRALVVDLPGGIPPGEVVWLRVEGRHGVVSPVSVEPLDQVLRDDLAYMGWRSLVFTTLLVLTILGLAFWGGTGERSYAYFSAMLACAIGYLATMGGDLRWIPGSDALFASGPRVNRIFGGLGIICSNLFIASYLALYRNAPVLNRFVHVGTAVAAATAAGSLFTEATVLRWTGNFALLYSAVVLLLAATVLSVRGVRAARVVLASWSPLMVFCGLAAAEMMGLWVGPTWLEEGLAAAFVLASLLLALGLSDKLLQLRRDRDLASRQATMDPVTKILNRHGIEERLFKEVEEARARGDTLSIAFVDLDRFKEINDRHGHAVGDQCLRIVCWRLRNQLRRGDMLGRYGGDEFLVVLPGHDAPSALAVAERMRVSVHCRPLAMPEASIAASLSIGVAELAPGESMSSLFERADTALYASKAAGRNRATAAAPPEGQWTT
jgi:diguanylate cyclase (GGDEF)-like protein